MDAPRPARLARMLRPQSIAFIGGAQVAGAIRTCRRGGYDGHMWVVNPTHADIEGIACVGSIADLPAPPDAALVALAPERAITAVGELAAMDAGGAVVMSAGFAEMGEVGRKRQAALRQAAGAMPVIGPNCMGVLNQFDGAAVWGDDNHMERQDGPAAALISQSGALLIGIANVEQAMPLGYAISTGNQAVVDMAECVAAVVSDERVRAIGLYIEGIDDGEALGQACLAAARKGVAVVALKGGDGEDGSKVAVSHTASMVVERDLWEAFCARFAIVEVTTPKALVETVKLVTIGGLPDGDAVSIVSYSGGLNGLAAARAGRLGLRLPPPTAPNQARLRTLLPETVAINNPMDLNIPYRSRSGVSMQDTRGVSEAICAFADGVADQVIFFIDVPRPGAAGLDRVWCDSLEALIEVRRQLGKPVSVAGILPEGLDWRFRRHMQENGVAALCGYGEAMEALAASAKLARRHDRLRGRPPPAPLLRCAPASCQIVLDEAASKRELAGFGLKTPPFEVVSPDHAGAAADRIGYPVALKAVSSQLAHKARAGGVRLDLEDREQVERAASEVVKAVAAADGQQIEQVLVEPMVADGCGEFIIGVKRHAGLGLALVIGHGGGDVEALARFETLLLPLEEGALDAALARLGPVDRSGLAAAAEAVAAYAEANAHRLVTLDVNPVIVTATGDAIAVDALIVAAGD